ncbi:hypothetical protein K470DRAFT_293597 [Piedraia hortae CBS 480.64]|uniref:Peroxin 26 n=1 Tax=Piedraia hortae CBS 480.64 TaxID=1314780 RepID=A0A6A7C704_9PEZI|nr:hypothetical protein K470DRAFT_293597 [Piedraia hortae CBS 480.64]
MAPRSRSPNSTNIIRAYKSASQLYLTKRFGEALTTLTPIITPRKDAPAAVSFSARGTRTKVWVFYISLLHALVELGSEDGAAAVGAVKWQSLASHVRSGAVWNEVVESGYAGKEEAVDEDVVINLTTLLLAHMSNQRTNQRRLETWWVAQERPESIHSAARLKILELYALHVLPTNGEWSEAKAFIDHSDALDEEQREAFKLALEQVREEMLLTEQKERELVQRREREMEAELQKAAEMAKIQQPKQPAKRSPLQKKSPQHQPPPEKQKSRSVAPPSGLSTRLSVLLKEVLPASLSSTRLAVFVIALLCLLARRDLRFRLRAALEAAWLKVRRTAGMATKVTYI